MLVEKSKVIPKKNAKNLCETKLYTKLSTIYTIKYHKCGIRGKVSSSKVCFGICDKITKKGGITHIIARIGVFGKRNKIKKSWQ